MPFAQLIQELFRIASDPKVQAEVIEKAKLALQIGCDLASHARREGSLSDQSAADQAKLRAYRIFASLDAARAAGLITTDEYDAKISAERAAFGAELAAATSAAGG